MWDLLLTNGVIITVDGEHHIYDKGYIGVEGTPLPPSAPWRSWESAVLPGSSTAKAMPFFPVWWTAMAMGPLPDPHPGRASGRWLGGDGRDHLLQMHRSGVLAGRGSAGRRRAAEIRHYHCRIHGGQHAPGGQHSAGAGQPGRNRWPPVSGSCRESDVLTAPIPRWPALIGRTAALRI